MPPYNMTCWRWRGRLDREVRCRAGKGEPSRHLGAGLLASTWESLRATLKSWRARSMAVYCSEHWRQFPESTGWWGGRSQCHVGLDIRCARAESGSKAGGTLLFRVPPIIFFLFFWLIDWLIDLWLCWVFVSVRGLSLVVANGGHSSSRCAGLSLSRPLLSWSTGSRRAGSAVVTHGPSCSAACGIFPDQGSNPCPLHWEADSQPLHHQGSPTNHFLKT